MFVFPNKVCMYVKIESAILSNTSLLHEYLPIAGSPKFREGAINLLWGGDKELIARSGGVQALGGTGALRLGLEFLRSRLHYETVYVSKPTWANHIGICKSLLYPNIKEYKYWDDKLRCLDLDNMLQDLNAAPDRSVVLLHACAHNPTGMDPTAEQWHRIAEVVKAKKMFVFFDCAYQGFSSGDVDLDVAAVRLFAKLGFEMFVAQSFSKNFGLYSERVGQLTYLVQSADMLPRLASNFSTIVRQIWSNPPAHGSAIVSAVLNDQVLTNEWKETVKSMAGRIQAMRRLLFDRLVALKTPGTWDHIVKQNGMFSFTGLDANQADYLINTHHIYLMKDGRINMCAITTRNVDYVAECIHDAVVKFLRGSGEGAFHDPKSGK
ncbi:hypothetical protein HELRODRAFT_158112 [Helobdella robusta]|uniref:aspartate transaminase n=1 Tax=Helobdella robusta TaxID=6412 RepID=T1EMJ5_HELRO|nr:hypothetical protein HELRODRAFT_158112 [Helobdella robusta]ESN90077.1 hypothetical protein HELRODRAFT_158112 [Helobdella robusta]